MKNCKLTVIVTAYNLEKYIAECIDSIICQDYIDKEIIVVDDGSVDKTHDILSVYEKDGFIKLISHPNKGVGYCRNEAFECATGDFVTFVDGDDKIAPGTYSQNMQYFIDNENIDCVVFPIVFRWTSDNEDCVIPQARLVEDKKDIYKEYLTYKVSFSVCDKIIRKSRLKEFHFRENIRYEDVDANRQILKSISAIMVSDKGLYLYRDNCDSFVRSKVSYKKIADYFDVIFSFLEQAQKDMVDHIYISYFVSRWLRLNSLLIYPLFDDTQRRIIINHTKKIKLSKPKLIAHLLNTSLSLRKFRALWSVAAGDLYGAILISNTDYDKKTFVNKYLQSIEQI